MSARLRFLGAPVTMRNGHLYRGRWRVPSSSDVDPCVGASQKVLDLFKIGGQQWIELGAFTNPTGLAVLDPEWPAGRRTALGGGCTVYSQGVWAAEPREIDFWTMQGQGPGGVELVEFWDQTDGEVLVGPSPLCGPEEAFSDQRVECVPRIQVSPVPPIQTPPVIQPVPPITVIKTPSDDTSETPNLFWLVATGVGLGVIIKALA